MKKLVGPVLFLFSATLAGMQFVRPARTNLTADSSAALRTAHPAGAILERSCYDCHSQQTRWPWYSSVAPTSWLVADHVRHARKHLDFSRWNQLEAPARRHLLEEICEEVEAEKMPLRSYLWIHRGARLSSDDVATLCGWTREEMSRLGPES
ncbi:MAG TPA: heme-binding domain-containing protein [Thermoanaerobaculia bacterium]|nr:heme-binding domain-containing protein [Thermoanaerobaculia bacterium]